MSLLVSYKSKDNVEYSIHTSTSESVTAHCDAFMGGIADTYSTVFHKTELSHQLNLMQQAVDVGVTLLVLVNGTINSFAYLLPVGEKRLNIIALHSYNVNPIAKLLLVNAIYNKNKILRVTPKEVICKEFAALLQPISHRLFKEDRTSFIKLKSPLFTNKLIPYLGLQVQDVL